MITNAVATIIQAVSPLLGEGAGAAVAAGGAVGAAVAAVVVAAAGAGAAAVGGVAVAAGAVAGAAAGAGAVACASSMASFDAPARLALAHAITRVRNAIQCFIRVLPYSASAPTSPVRMRTT